MKINKPAIEHEQQESKRLTLKTKLILGLLALIALESAAFYLYFTQIRSQIEQATQVQTTYNTLEQEKQRCNQIISQGEGQFDQYEYCTLLINTFK